ncbi:MAG: sugar transferase [Actinomycetota bacterium]|nr:MAG: sugar transferase [Actinomycetota bacterium]
MSVDRISWETEIASWRSVMPATRAGSAAEPSSGSGQEHLTAKARRRSPLLAYQRVCLVLDLVAIVGSAALAYVLRFSIGDGVARPDTLYVATALLLAIVWICVLAWRGAYDARSIGTGTEEHKRVVGAALLTFGTVASLSFLFDTEVSRAFVVISIPLGLLASVAGRLSARRWLRGRRGDGRYLYRTLLIGTPHQTFDMRTNFDADRAAGFRVVSEIDPPSSAAGVDLWLDALADHLYRERVDAVAVGRCETVTPDVLRRLAWTLEGPRIDLMVAPGFTDFAGPRLSVRPAAGLPLIHLDEPRLTRPQRFLKGAFDRTLAALALVLLSPVLLVIALLVGLTSRGGVFYTQYRVGRKGKLFRCWKFRSMVTGADRLRAEVLGTPDASMPDRYRTDPRITGVGRFLRRWSLDELPQLFNVLGGSMSIVGPRPMLPDEMSLLETDHHRRHLTKPGLTGLWQINGRKQTTWDERMHLDLSYVEQWSPALDLVIIAKTMKVVLTGHGAY